MLTSSDGFKLMEAQVHDDNNNNDKNDNGFDDHAYVGDDGIVDANAKGCS